MKPWRPRAGLASPSARDGLTRDGAAGYDERCWNGSESLLWAVHSAKGAEMTRATGFANGAVGILIAALAMVANGDTFYVNGSCGDEPWAVHQEALR